MPFLNKEKTIYGDYDADGITSITVLKSFLETNNLQVDYYIPNRLEEGYGLNIPAVEKIAKEKYDLMITVDCGISCIEELAEISTVEKKPLLEGKNMFIILAKKADK